MIKNYFKVAIRNISRNKLTSVINIAGLALALNCAVLIYFYVADELSYDRYNVKHERMYRVGRDFLSQDGTVNLRLSSVAPPVGPLLKNDFGEIERVARTIAYPAVLALEENGEVKKSIFEEKVFVAEPDILKIFDFRLKNGDASTALSRPFTMMMTPDAAMKYFGTEDVIGKRLRADNAHDLEITGLFEALPAQSHWHPEYLVSFSSLEDSTVYGRKALETNWGNNAFGTYVLLHEGVAPSKLQPQMPAFIDRHFGAYSKQQGAPADFVASKTTRLNLQRVTDIHLHSNLDDELEANGNINNVYMISVIGLFIVLIACFNFINLATAQATKRSKEVGLRKVIGAARNQLVAQHLSESVLMSAVALIIAVGFAMPGIDILNAFTGKHIHIDLLGQWPVTGGMILFALALGLLAGLYPAFIISGYKPVIALKSDAVTTGKGGLRKALVVAQFAISVGLIIATAITSQQLRFLNTRDLGYDKDQIIVLPLFDELSKNYQSFYNELTKSSLVKNAARSSRIPTGRLLDSYGDAKIVSGTTLTSVGVSLKTIATDEEFFSTYGIGMAAGRPFSKSIPTDDSLAFIINEAAAAKIGWTNPELEVGRDFEYAGVKGKLVGIAKDFHFESLHQSIVPMVFLEGKGNLRTMSVKLAGANTQDGIAYVEKVWRQFAPSRPFDYEFLSDKYKALYESEQKQSQLFTVFSGLAIFIACLGLFGLATFNTMLRVREIGIRKVLGASVPGIVTLLSKEIVILIIVANVIAWPVVWILMSKWLNGFAYHIEMNVFIYVLASVIAVVIALLTVSVQTLKAATTNPAKTLRRE